MIMFSSLYFLNSSGAPSFTHKVKKELHRAGGAYLFHPKTKVVAPEPEFGTKQFTLYLL